ncbi:MAG: DUF4270 family protein [Chitinophagaceae bacterium]
MAIVLVALGLHSCDKADITFGDQWVENEYTQVTLLDTITPSVSTIYLDTFATNGTGYSMIGVYEDPEFGVVSASTYLRLQPPTITTAIVDSLDEAVFDSAVVYLNLKNGEYGDTTQTLTLNVQQLSADIRYHDNTSYLYNTTTFPVNETSIGSGTFTLNPNAGLPLTGDTLTIRLTDDFGSDLFSKLKTYSYYLRDATDFLTYLRGIKISASATNNNGFIFNASDSAFIRLYYSLPATGTTVHQHTDFTINSTAYQFNNISIDRTGTVLGSSGISYTNKKILTTETGNIAFLQPSTQTAVKVTFPTIKALEEQPNYLKLVRAVLVVAGPSNSYLPYYAVPPTLYAAYTKDRTNSYSESSVLATASSYQNTTTRQYTYSLDLTSYFQTYELPYTDNLTDRGIVLFLPSSAYKSTVNRLLIGDAVNEANGDGGIKLQLYYISVQ